MATTPYDGLAATQARVALLLAHGATVTDAAETAGLHRSTVYRWVKSDDKFRMAMHQGRAEYTLTLRDDLRELSEIALRTVMGVLTDPLTTPPTRLKAATFVLTRPEFPQRTWAMPVSLAEVWENFELTEDNPVIAEDYRRMREREAARAAEAAPPPAESGPAAPPEAVAATECDTMRRFSVFSRLPAPNRWPAKMPPAGEQSAKTGADDGEPADDWPEDAA